MVMADFNHLDRVLLALSGCIALLMYWAGLVIYRITLHPLAKIPGPKLAAVSLLYQTYYSTRNGQSRFYQQVELLHKQHGPIVRIAPNEISLSDPANYEKIYNIRSKFYKDPDFYGAFGAQAAAFTTASNELHRVRRAALNPMFSRKVVLELEDVVQDKVKKLSKRLERGFREANPNGVDLHYGFRAVSVDVITDYAFNDCYNLLDREDFGHPFFAMVKGTIGAFWIFIQWPLVQAVALNMPHWLVFSPSIKLFNKFLGETRQKIAEVKSRFEAGKTEERPSVFTQLLNPNATEGHVVPNLDQLVDDAFIIVAAASDTTGNAMTIAAYHVINNPIIYATLKEELKGVFPDKNQKLDFVALEKLPYLTAVVKEGLRLSFGVVGRLPRVTPEGGGHFNGYSVPEGTVVGMSSWMMHHNPAIFPDPCNFDPSRWLNPERAQFQEKYLVAFGKGSRQCVGMQLAHCELYVTLGTIFRRFGNLRVHGIRHENLVLDDYFSSYHPDNVPKFHVVQVEI